LSKEADETRVLEGKIEMFTLFKKGTCCDALLNRGKKGRGGGRYRPGMKGGGKASPNWRQAEDAAVGHRHVKSREAFCTGTLGGGRRGGI